MDVEDQICVLPGDILGIHYEGASGEGVAPYEQKNRARTSGLGNVNFSRLVNIEIGDNELPIGKTMPTTTISKKRVPALNPILSNGPQWVPSEW